LRHIRCRTAQAPKNRLIVNDDGLRGAKTGGCVAAALKVAGVLRLRAARNFIELARDGRIGTRALPCCAKCRPVRIAQLQSCNRLLSSRMTRLSGGSGCRATQIMPRA